jgi:site-specific DNA-methyltransferase (adenine-specific)
MEAKGMMELDRLYNMDCMDGMAQFPDGYFDLAVTDPPYGIGADSMGFATSGPIRVAGTRRRDYRRGGGAWDTAPGAEYFDELRRVSKSQIVWGGNYFSSFLPPSRCFVCWDKRLPSSSGNSFADCELAWAPPSFGVARMFRFLWDGMLQGDMKNKEERIHPTQKPVALYAWLLSKYAKPGWRIIDTHAGSASSLVACWRAGLPFIGFERDAGYFKSASQRLAAEMAQMRLGEPGGEKTRYAQASMPGGRGEER